MAGDVECEAVFGRYEKSRDYGKNWTRLCTNNEASMIQIEVTRKSVEGSQSVIETKFRCTET
jgi:hypothetical protein